jgi:hypothetical protein
MAKAKVFLPIALVLFLVVAAVAADKVNVPANLPEIKFEKPPSAEVQTYLGLSKMEPFTLSQIQGKMVIIEIMSAL